MDVSGIAAIVYGFSQISKLPEAHHHHDHTIDKCLLRFALFCSFIFRIFTGATGVFPKPEKDAHSSIQELFPIPDTQLLDGDGGSNALHVLNTVIGIASGIMQVLFIEALMDKTVEKGQKILHGRQVDWHFLEILKYLSGCHLPYPAEPWHLGGVHLWTAEGPVHRPGGALLRD